MLIDVDDGVEGNVELPAQLADEGQAQSAHQVPADLWGGCYLNRVDNSYPQLVGRAAKGVGNDYQSLGHAN